MSRQASPCAPNTSSDVHAHVQALRKFYARGDDGNFIMKSDTAFWHPAEKALVATVQLEARGAGALLSDQQIHNAATRYCWTSPCHSALSVPLVFDARTAAGVWVLQQVQHHGP